MSDTHTVTRPPLYLPPVRLRHVLAPVPATPAQIIPTADTRDLRAWEANEIGAPADERFSATGSR